MIIHDTLKSWNGWRAAVLSSTARAQHSINTSNTNAGDLRENMLSEQ